MPEGVFRSDREYMDLDQEQDMLYARTVELERELMKARRTEKVLREMEQRYITLMDSDIFLHIVLSPSGLLRVMNRRAEEFFGFSLKMGAGVTLQSLSGPGYTGEVESLLQEAVDRPVHATFSLVRSGGDLGWVDAELSWSTYQGEPSLVLLATDVTDLAIAADMEVSSGEYAPAWALQTLACCPGLLCFAVDRNGVLLYATRGYREVAKRFLGHECACGYPYPSEIETAFDLELQELLADAFRGNTSITTLSEQGDGVERRWNVTAAPLASAQGDVAGAVVHLTPLVPAVPATPPTPVAPNADKVREVPLSPEKVGFSQLELLNAVRRMLVVLDGEGRCVEANAYFLQILKLRRDDIAGRAFADLAMANEPLNDGLSDKILRLTQKGSQEEVECKLSSRDGEVLTLGLSASSVRWGSDIATLVSCTDNTKLRRTEEQLKRMSSTDSSTGTLNRHGMERALGREIERAVRYRGSLAIVMLDIDGFRHLNERIGYAASDQILKDLAVALRSRIRSTDFLGRWGGDEFMILTPSPVATTWQLAETLRDMVEHQTFGDNVGLTLSAGVAEFRKSMDISAFVACAYDAMTEAKRSGGNRSVQARQAESEEAAAVFIE